MASENLVDDIRSLTPEQQESVKQFVEFLREKDRSESSTFLQLSKSLSTSIQNSYAIWRGDQIPEAGAVIRATRG